MPRILANDMPLPVGPPSKEDVIAAIATPPGRGGIGIIRISGKNLQPLARILLGKSPEPRRAEFGGFFDEHGQVLDRGILLYFPAPHSYTGEDVIELHGHGGPVIMNLLLSRCLQLGARLAEPGEFTLRAFLNNKMDLLQAESVIDLINASTADAARCAIRSLSGEFSAAITRLTQALIHLRMLVEATLDFPEEELDFLQSTQAIDQLQRIQQQLEQVLAASRQGALLQSGIHIALVGRPNVGKSSLLNQLAQADVAIVTEFPGTTRDTIRQSIEIEGIPLHLVDTAGLRETSDVIEQQGIARTYDAAKQARLILLVIDSCQGVTSEDRGILACLPQELPVLMIYNKIDLSAEMPRITENEYGTAIYLSAKSGAGIDLLRSALLQKIGWQANIAGEGLYMARQRHLQALIRASQHLQSAAVLLDESNTLELLAEELRLAQQELSAITGEFTADDLLGNIFSNFCIGK